VVTVNTTSSTSTSTSEQSPIVAVQAEEEGRCDGGGDGAADRTQSPTLSLKVDFDAEISGLTQQQKEEVLNYKYDFVLDENTKQKTIHKGNV
jgi:hypothetical protein